MALHARLEKAKDVRVVGITSKSQTSAIVHVILELLRLIQAEFIKTDFLLLSLDVSVLLSLASTWQALPGKRSSQEVDEHMTNGFQVVSSRLLVTNVSVD